MQIISGNGEATSAIPTEEKTPVKETIELPSGNNISTNAKYTTCPDPESFYRGGPTYCLS